MEYYNDYEHMFYNEVNSTERTILHADINFFYAAVECLYNPDIRNKPVAVTGDPEARHGIVLTKNTMAKAAGIQTGEVIWQAKQKCPQLVCVPPDYPMYLRFSQSFRKILSDYSDKVESFGLDEAWVDVSGPKTSIEEGTRIADEIRHRTAEELGVTISVGVSYNKIFAKLGSDMNKPDATTTVSQKNFQTKVWPLPASDLLYVGRSTMQKLSTYGIRTIGDLAQAPEVVLKGLLGKNGLVLKVFAMGLDPSPVMPVEASVPIKSIGNSTTAPHDLETLDDARCIYYLLAESVATRLRENGFRSTCISISARDTKLVATSCQRTLRTPTNLTGEIARAALVLFQQRYLQSFPLRSVGISCGSLVPERTPQQLDLFADNERRERELELEYILDDLRSRYGQKVVVRGITMADKDYAIVNPKEEHIIHPVSFFGG